MIYAYVGRPRSGKSLDAVKLIVSMLKQGRVVCSDIEGLEQLPGQCRDPREFDKHCRVVISELTGITIEKLKTQLIFLTPDEVLRFWVPRTEEVTINAGTDLERKEMVFVPICPAGSMIVIDEVHKKFSCHDNRESKNRQFADWASTHGHDGYDVVLITQDIMKVESHIRSLVETTYYYRKVNFFGSMFTGRYMRYVYDGYEHDGKPICSPTTHSYDKEYYRAYKSMSHRNVIQWGVTKNVNILKHPVFFAIPVVISLCLYMFFQKSSFASGDVFGVSKTQHKYDALKKKNAAFKNTSSVKPAPVASIAGSPAFTQPVQVPFKTVSPPESKYVAQHVTGYIVADEKTYIQVAGYSFQLPHPNILKFNKSTMTAFVDAEYFGLNNDPQQVASYEGKK